MEALRVVSPVLPFAFILYVAFSTLVLLNLVTGVFVDTAQRMRERDRHKELRLGLERAIKKTGVRINQLVSNEEFAQLIEHKDMLAFLKGHHLNDDSVRTVFYLLHKKEGKLSPGRFIDFCLRLQGVGNAIELAKLHLTGVHDRDLLRKGHEKGAKERRQIILFHEQAARERVELKRLYELGDRDRRELKDLHARAIEDRSILNSRLSHIEAVLCGGQSKPVKGGMCGLDELS